MLNAQYARADRQWTAADTLKNVVVMLRHPDGQTEPLVIGVPGDREVDMKRVAAQVSPAEVDVFDEAAFALYPALVRGYIGPTVLGLTSASEIRYLLDPRVVVGSEWVTGANQQDVHVAHLVHGRDFTADGTIEAAEILAGDPCPLCSSPLEIARGIEIGHVFQLGRKYAEIFGLSVLDKNGKPAVVTMGSYGIGVSRAVASIAEVFHDDLGLRWPRAIAPADVHIVITGKGDDGTTQFATDLAQQLETDGLKVLLDDRASVSPGVKFKDAELLGMPIIVIVGRGLAAGTIEVRDRLANTTTDVSSDTVAAHIVTLARSDG